MSQQHINWLKDEETRLVKALAGVMMLNWDKQFDQSAFWSSCNDAIKKYGNKYLSQLKGSYFNKGRDFDMFDFAAHIKRTQGLTLTENKLWQRGDKAAKGARDRETHVGEWNKIERPRDFWLNKLHVKLPIWVEYGSDSESSESSTEMDVSVSQRKAIQYTIEQFRIKLNEALDEFHSDLIDVLEEESESE